MTRIAWVRLLLVTSSVALASCYHATRAGRECDECDEWTQCGGGLECIAGLCAPVDRPPGDPCDGPDTDLCEEGEWTCSDGQVVCDDRTGDAEEACNEVDDDCDGEVDEGCDCTGPWVQAVPVGEALSAVWVAPDGDIYGAGLRGAIVHVEGARIDRMASGTTADLRGIWGSDEGDIYAAGEGVALHYDGSGWSPLPVDGDFYAVYGTSRSSVFLASDDGRLLHFDGSAWTEEAREGYRFIDLWGRPDGTVFAFGRVGDVLRFDGSGWDELSSFPGVPDDPRYRGAWGSSGGDIFAISCTRSIVHFDGAGFESIDSGASGALVDVWGRSADDVYFVGTEGRVLHFDGVALTPMDSGTSETLRAIRPGASGDLVAVGGASLCPYDQDTASSVITRYDGRAWSAVASLPPPVSFRDVLVPAAGDVLVVGAGRTACGCLGFWEYCWACRYAPIGLERWTSSLGLGGGRWRGASLAGLGVTAVWGAAGDDVVGVVGARGADGGDEEPASALAYYDGSSWRVDSHEEWPSTWSDVWGASEDDVFAVGPSIEHFDGERWTEMEAPAGADKVWGASGADVFAVHENTVLHYDGESWTVTATFDADVRLRSVWGSSGTDVFVVGGAAEGSAPDGRIFHCDGTAWTEMSVAFDGTLNDVWGSSGSDVFAVGTGGTILRYQGSTWERMDSGTTEDLNAVSGSSSTDVYAVGENGTILHRCGLGW